MHYTLFSLKKILQLLQLYAISQFIPQLFNFYFFHWYCNQYEPRPVSDILYFGNSIETIILKNLTVCYPICPFLILFPGTDPYDPRPVIIYYIVRNAIEISIVRSTALYPHQLCCLRFDTWSIIPILAL